MDTKLEASDSLVVIAEDDDKIHAATKVPSVNEDVSAHCEEGGAVRPSSRSCSSGGGRHA